MGTMSLMGMLEMSDLGTALRWHLSNNLWPPVPESMLDACSDAIRLCADNHLEDRVELPDGVVYQDGESSAPAWALVEDFRLELFVEQEGENPDG